MEEKNKMTGNVAEEQVPEEQVPAEQINEASGGIQAGSKIKPGIPEFGDVNPKPDPLKTSAVKPFL